MMTILAAHGTRDPVGRRTIEMLAGAVGRDVPVRLAWLEHATPTVAEALGAGGARRVVPLLLGAGFHVDDDLPALLARCPGIRLGSAIGPEPGVIDALADRLGAAGHRPGQAVVLAAAGSRRPGWHELARLAADRLSARLRVAVRLGVLSGPGPSVREAVARLRAEHGAEPAAAAYLLAQGRFHRDLQKMRLAVTARPLGCHPGVVAAVTASARR